MIMYDQRWIDAMLQNFGNHQDAKICRSKLRWLGNAWNLLVVCIMEPLVQVCQQKLAKFSDLLGHTAPTVKLRSKEPNLAMLKTIRNISVEMCHFYPFPRSELTNFKSIVP